MLKPGYKTTEFWVTTLASVGALVAALTSNLSPKYAAIGAAIAQGAYAISRGITKHGALSQKVVVPPPTTVA